MKRCMFALCSVTFYRCWFAACLCFGIEKWKLIYNLNSLNLATAITLCHECIFAVEPSLHAVTVLL